MQRNFWSAIRRNDESRVRQLLDQGARVDVREKRDGYTYLMLSTCLGNVSISRMLIQSGCPINAISGYGQVTALHLAVFLLKYQIASELIEHGADVNIKNENGCTALQIAVVNLTHMDLLEEVVPNGVQLKEKRAYCVDCIFFAELSRSKRTIQNSIATKSDNSSNRLYLTKMLLDAGADVNDKNKYDSTPIHSAVYTGDLNLVRTLINAGANLNNQNIVGATALHEAVLCCNEQMIDLLLSHGASVATRTKFGNTPLHWASMLNVGSAILTKLMQFGSIHMNDLNADALTAFDICLQHGDVDSVKLFIEMYNANLMKVDSHGFTTLHYAACNPDPNVMKLVLQKTAHQGIAVDQTCDNGWTALHIASKEARPQNVRELIARGANVNAMDKEGKTALYLIITAPQSSALNQPALGLASREVVDLLLEHGTDLNQKILQGHEQKTILEVAIKRLYTIWSRVIIMHAAKVEAITKKRVFDDYNEMMVIKQDEMATIQYANAQIELKTMSNAVFEGTSITHLSLLTRSEEELVRYVRNKDLVYAFDKSYDRITYLYYGPILKKKFDAAVAKQEKMEKVCNILSELLQFANSDHPAFEKIYYYLSENDVNILLENALKCLY